MGEGIVHGKELVFGDECLNYMKRVLEALNWNIYNP